MGKFAEIRDGFVRYIYECETKPEMEPSIVLINLDFIKPEPQVGWKYDGKNFFEPVLENNFMSMDIVRKKRNELITNNEWIINRHIQQKALGVETSITELKYYEWLNYFEQLRNLTTMDVNKIVWPKQP